MKIIAWATKTRTGRVYPSWIFETKEEAQDFCDDLNDKYRPQTHYVFEVEIITHPLK